MDRNLALELIKSTILLRVKASRIILFGSYAQGSPDSESDLDVMVIVPDGTVGLLNLERQLYSDLVNKLCMPCDVLVSSEASFLERAKLPTLERVISQEGSVLYAA